MFAKALFSEMMGEYNTAIATYQGDMDEFFGAIAFNLQVPTEDEQTGKPLKAKQLKKEIIKNCNEYTLLIIPKAKRLTTAIKYWVEKMMQAGAIVVCLSVVKPVGEIFLEMLEIELDLPSNKTIREIMRAEANILGLELTSSEIADLQASAGKNPLVARKVIRKHALNLKQGKIEHSQYIVIMPIIIACLMAFGIVRFIGMGTRNKGLYIFGGVTLVAGMTLKQLGQVKGARKRFGQ